MIAVVGLDLTSMGKGAIPTPFFISATTSSRRRVCVWSCGTLQASPLPDFKAVSHPKLAGDGSAICLSSHSWVWARNKRIFGKLAARCFLWVKPSSVPESDELSAERKSRSSSGGVSSGSSHSCSRRPMGSNISAKPSFILLPTWISVRHYIQKPSPWITRNTCHCMFHLPALFSPFLGLRVKKKISISALSMNAE